MYYVFSFDIIIIIIINEMIRKRLWRKITFVVWFEFGKYDSAPK